MAPQVSSIPVPHSFADYLQTFVSILTIINPLGAIPLFIGMTAGDPPAKMRSQARTAAIAVFIVMLVAAWLGEPLLRLFGIGIPAFRVGGGILILLLAISMMYAKQTALKQTPVEKQEAAVKENVAVVPLAMPLLAGPGTISTVILNANDTTHWRDKIAMHIGIALTALIVWGALRSASIVARALGQTGINIATRLMGMILAAISIEFIAAGAVQLFPGLMGAPGR